MFYGPVAGLAIALSAAVYFVRRYIQAVERSRDRAEAEAEDWKERAVHLMTATEKVTDVANKAVDAAAVRRSLPPDVAKELEELRMVVTHLADALGEDRNP